MGEILKFLNSHNIDMEIRGKALGSIHNCIEIIFTKDNFHKIIDIHMIELDTRLSTDINQFIFNLLLDFYDEWNSMD